MAAALWATTILLVLHAAHSYILLTANMDDVQAIAKQMLSSPVVDQIEKIWRRATVQFNQRLKRPRIHKRTDELLNTDEGAPANGVRSRSGFLSDSFKERSRRALDDLSELGRNASGYLQSLRRVFDDFTQE